MSLALLQEPQRSAVEDGWRVFGGYVFADPYFLGLLLAVPVVLCGLTRWRFPLVWSALIPLTYVSYATEPYAETLWVVGVEYGVVLACIAWEGWRQQSGLG